MFRVGQKVVAIAKQVGGYGDEAEPIVGSVYTIRSIDLDRAPTVYPIGLRLVEIVNKPRSYRGLNGDVFHEGSFGAHKFRPLVERKTDISIFKAMLTPNRVNA